MEEKEHVRIALVCCEMSSILTVIILGCKYISAATRVEKGYNLCVVCTEDGGRGIRRFDSYKIDSLPLFLQDGKQ